MIGYYLIILIYLSFIFDFIVWPIPSEASTNKMLIKSSKSKELKSLIFYILNLLIIIYSISPLIITIKRITTNTEFSYSLIAIFGLIVSITGRLITLTGSRMLINKNSNQLITYSIFKYSRNPISLGVHLTLLGFILIYPKIILIGGFGGYLIYMHWKISEEEKYLIKKYGENYINYKYKTPRYLIK